MSEPTDSDGGGGGSPANDGGADQKQVYRTFLLFASIGLAGALLYAAAASSTWGTAAGVFGGAALIAGAFALAGGLVGFLFAIPRSRQEGDRAPQPELPASGTARKRLSDYSANTNLEQISDWLTKILVGISLVQFGQMSERFDTAATTLAPLLGTGGPARPMTLALMSYFALWGFFVAYLLTRLWLPKALSRAERDEEVQRREAERDSELRALERRAYDFLYEAPPGGFTRAIEAIESYHAGRGSLQSPWLWLYLAAAYGQKHRFEMERDRRAEADEARDRARAAVAQALKLDSGTKPILQQLYRGNDAGENDLASLRGDPRLDELLGAEPQEGAA
jgi:hypothetical protein